MRDIKVTRPTQISVDANFPVSGKAKNISSAGDNTGTPWIEDIINDRSFGWQERILSIAGIVPNGLEENASQSQISEAIEILIKIVSSGYNAVGSFRWGLVYTSDNDVGIYQGKAYKYVGGDSYPVTVPVNTVDPSVASDYEEVVYNPASNVNLDEGISVQEKLNISKGLTVAEAVNYNGISSLLGSRVWLKDRGIWTTAVLTSTVTPDGIATIQSIADPLYSLVIVDNGEIDLTQLGAVSGQNSGVELEYAFNNYKLVNLGSDNNFISDRNLAYSGKLIGVNSSITFNTGFGLTTSNGFVLGETVKIIGDKADLNNVGSRTKYTGNISNPTQSQGLTLNAAGISEVMVLGAYIEALSFPVLVNQNATGGDLIVGYSNIKGINGDAVEVNTPLGAEWYNTVITSNILSGGVSGSGTNAGFSLGVAQGKNVVSIGNLSKESRNEGYHVEDDSYGIVTVGNLFAGNLKDGSRIINKADQKMLVHVANSFVKERDPLKATWQTDYGYYNVFDANGTSQGNVVVGNGAEGFERGFNLGSIGVGVLSGNVAYDCATAYFIGQRSNIMGHNLSFGCDVAVVGNQSMCGHIAIDDCDTTEVLINSSATAIGSVLSGFSGKSVGSTAGGTSLSAKVCKLTSTARMDGRLTVLASQGTTTGVFATYEINWDGTTLTVTQKAKKIKGDKDAVDPIVTADVLYARVFSASAVTDYEVNFVFDGAYYYEGTS